MNPSFFQSSTNNVRKTNKFAALDLIRFSPGGISRAELADRMGLSRAAITAIVKDLLEQELIYESFPRSEGAGRPPIMLQINPKRGYVIGMDMGATHLRIVLADLAARVLHEEEYPFDIAAGPQASLSQLNGYIENLLQAGQVTREQVLAIGLGVPGPVRNQEGMVLAPPIMPGWDRFPIRDTVARTWGVPVMLNNDAELGALGEWAYGAGRDYENLIFIKIGSGIGAGMILNNQLYQGADGSAGEIGHITVEENGPQCKCGNYGCLEALAGGNAIARQARELVARGAPTQLAGIPPEQLTARQVAMVARKGDLAAQRLFNQAGKYIGIGIASLVNLFNPEIVIVGGGVAQVGDMLLEPLRQTVRQRALAASTRNLRITSALLGRRSVSMGAVIQAISLALLRLTADSFQS
jgi:glucokinase-like ROK family protein